jgi:hypothetical protein
VRARLRKERSTIDTVITGPDPVIHLFGKKGLLRRLMDARIKAGHD